jgi:uncharacterized membrane protein
MATNRFSMSEAIRFGWNTMKANLGFFIGLLIVVWVISLIFILGRLATYEDAPLLTFLIGIVEFIIASVMTMGLIKITLKFCDNQKGQFSDLFSCFPLFFKYLGASILYGLIVLGGLILLIVPGIIWGIKFQFFGYFIVDKGLGPTEALKASSAITKGVKWDLFLFELLLGLINLLGFICLFIGLFATAPTTNVALAFVYRKLESQLGAPQASVAPQQP